MPNRIAKSGAVLCVAQAFSLHAALDMQFALRNCRSSLAHIVSLLKEIMNDYEILYRRNRDCAAHCNRCISILLQKAGY